MSPTNVACLSKAELTSTVVPAATASEVLGLDGTSVAPTMLELDVMGVMGVMETVPLKVMEEAVTSKVTEFQLLVSSVSTTSLSPSLAMLVALFQ